MKRGTVEILLILLTVPAFMCAGDPSSGHVPKELWMHPNKYDDAWVNDDSQWNFTANNIDVFGFFGMQINNARGALFQMPLLTQKGIRVNVEVGALRQFQCDGTAFFETIDTPIFDKLVKGGHGNFVASMDAPFTYTVKDGFWSQCGQLYAGGTVDPLQYGCSPQAPNCDMTVEQAAGELVEYLSLFSERYPDASIGWIEPLPLLKFGSYPSENPPIPEKPFPDFKEIADVLIQKIDAHNETNDPDIRLRFFHSDWYFTGMFVPTIQKSYDAWDKHIAISSYLREKGLRFGILLNDYRESLPTQDGKNKAFFNGVLNYYDCWHVKGGTLDDIVAESWISDHPSAAVPEDEPYTFTNVMVELAKKLADPDYVHVCDEQRIISEILSLPPLAPPGRT